jgi:hypothetical protein
MMRNPEFVPGITGSDYWVNLIGDQIRQQADLDMPDAQESKYHERVLIFDDARFLNELEVIRKNSGRLIYIDATDRLTDLDAPWRQHLSEQVSWDYLRGVLPDTTFDQVLVNYRTEADFRAFVRMNASRWLLQAEAQ